MTDTATINDYKAGDTVRRIRGNDLTPFVIERVEMNSQRPTHSRAYRGDFDYHHFENLEMVAAAPVEPAAPRPFQAGDTFRRAAGHGDTAPIFTVTRTDPMSNVDRVWALNERGEEVWWRSTVIELVAAGPRPFQVGDVVIGSAGSNRTIADFHPSRFDSGLVANFTNGASDPVASLTLVTPAPRPFGVGDTVTLRHGSHTYRLTSKRSAAPRASWDLTRTVSGYETWDYEDNFTLVTPAPDATKPERKLGETPDGDNIAVNDPRIAWIWADLGTYADGKDWCPEYEALAKVIGVPGRVKKFSGHILVAGQRVEYKDIEAESARDAREAFRTQLVGQLTAQAA